MLQQPELSTASLLKLGSFLFWGGLYLWVSAQFPRESPEWWSRAVTLLHGSVATVVGLTQCGVTTLSAWTLTMKIGGRHYALMVWSWGYFAFDLLWCLTYWREYKLMLCHHISSLVAITIYMHKDYTGCTFACNLAMMELGRHRSAKKPVPTTGGEPVVNKAPMRSTLYCKRLKAIAQHKASHLLIYRLIYITKPNLTNILSRFLRKEGYDKTLLYYVVEMTYLVLFVMVRGILGTYVIYKIVQSDIFDMDEKAISVEGLRQYLDQAGFVSNNL
ncbi:unnamed protein product [Chilo suppressalis]|uniref:TLC domain-containing protein n=1 Tax=Chilo suppressalis TaxID=168631 RepID=A0ABN8BCG9_CHISP|nr:unnamed protein product [Chilo suppressalis]